MSPTSPEDRLEARREAQRRDKRRIAEIRDRIEERAKAIAKLARRVAVATRLARHGVRSPYLVLAEADRAGVGRALAIAILERETGIPQRNVFGCDHGRQGGQPPYCGDEVTKARVAALRASGMANGVGWTQLTWPAFVERADRIGGAHLPKYQMRVGFGVLADNIDRLGLLAGVKAYNGTGAAADEYADDVVNHKAPRWRGILEGR
jgi:hypothetical protein